MTRMPFPPGFRFHPTDAELIMYYLKRKVMGKKLVYDAVTELNVYNFAPWDLPDKCLLKSKDLEWYFFCSRKKKYASGARLNRATENGFWKITGTDRLVTINKMTVGARKTLIFYKGQPPKGERTDWVMHEYRLRDEKLVDVVQDAYVLCKIFQKGGLGPKNGEQYGALFNEEEWDDMDNIFVESQSVAHQISSEDVPVPLGDINKIDAVSLSVPRDLLDNFVPEPDPSRCLPQNTIMQPSIKEICVESLAIDPHILPDYVPPDTIGSSAAICMAAPRNPFTWSTSESGPYTDGPPVMDILPDMDIPSLLNMFTEGTDMPPVENNSIEKFEINEHLPLLDENGIYNDLGDQNDWLELRDIEFGISTEEAAYDPNPVFMGENAPFLELNDLSSPLRYPSDAGELDWLQTSSIYGAHTYDMSIGMDEFCSGVAKPCPLESGSGEYSAVLGQHLLGNNLKELGKGNCIDNFKAPGFDAVGGSEVPFAITEPEGTSNAEENLRRGEQQMNLQLPLESVSFHVRAEHVIVSFHFPVLWLLRVKGRGDTERECTKDALLHNMEESDITFTSRDNQIREAESSRMQNSAIYALLSCFGMIIA